ncbi:hypothetical protein SAY86_002242 [Trapa natans]|uniref:Response regulatory domain-containing protein n=1 Tax=Trapa natans TaxID=22666 RepID=A0AAN7R4K1_TRANT|nr:hypothetical protein SAY86_002242 [Trapa natans]
MSYRSRLHPNRRLFFTFPCSLFVPLFRFLEVSIFYPWSNGEKLRVLPAAEVGEGRRARTVCPIRRRLMSWQLTTALWIVRSLNGSLRFRLAKESSVLKKIPVVVVIMSSQNVLARVNQCLEEGAEDFIVKPVKLSDVRRLKDYMNRDLGPGRAPARATTTTSSRSSYTRVRIPSFNLHRCRHPLPHHYSRQLLTNPWNLPPDSSYQL